MDIIIVYSTQKRFFDRYDDFIEIFDIIKNTAIDILIYTPEEMKSMSERKFIADALEQGELLYGG